jgi:competence protein ComEA
MTKRIRKWSAAAVVVAVALACASGGLAHAAAGTAPKDRPDPVDINSASASDLEKVPGIGPSLSKRIIEFREKNGPYSSVEDLLKIQGIGEKSLARFRDYLTAVKPQKK